MESRDEVESGSNAPSTSLRPPPRTHQPFFTTKPVGKGTGQGLTISRQVIVNKHGGELFFESVVGQGTTFVIRLPANDKACDQLEAA